MGCLNSSSIEDQTTQASKNTNPNVKNNINTTDNNEDQKGDVKSNANNKNKEDKNTLTLSTNSKIKNLKKSNYNGITLMQGIEDFFPEDVTLEDLYQIVEESIKENIIDDKIKTDDPKAITRKQAKVIAKVLYDKIKKGKNDNKGDIDIKKYPELKGKNIKISVRKFTKEVVKEYIYNNQAIDDCQIDITYTNLTKNNEVINALTIEIND